MQDLHVFHAIFREFYLVGGLRTYMKTRNFCKWAVLTVVLALLIGFLPSHAAVSDPYFTAVNDTLLKLSDDTMPFSLDGRYYVPYTVFDDLSLGVSYTYNKKQYTLTFYNRNNTLVFDLLQNYAYDLDQQYWESAISKNNTLYIPIEFVCEEFGLEFTYISPVFSSIPILRIVSESNLDDYSFQLKHSRRLIAERNAYYKTPSPSASASPSPSPGQPQTTPEQDDKPEKVCLTVDCETADGIGEVLDLLDQYGVKAVFFLSENFAAEERDLVRRIIGSGHQTGILDGTVPGGNEEGSSESAVERARRVNGILDSYTCTKTRFVRFTASRPGGALEAQISALVNAGYSHGAWTIDEGSHKGATARQTAINIIGAMEEADDVPVVRLRASSDLPEIFINILAYLNNYNISIIKITQV